MAEAGRQGTDPSRHRVLIVDDEVYIAEALVTSLRYAGFDGRATFTGAGALDSVADWSPDLLLLDVMLPDMSGYDVCRRMVMDGHDAGVIFLSARDEISDRVRGFSVGADDYVTKPFSLEEVVARVRAVLLRRSRGRTSAALAEATMRYSDLVLDDERHLVTRGDVAVDLSPTEYSLLRFLLQNPERVMSKAQILDHVWRYDFNGDAGVVETFVSLLRKKLNAAGPPLVQTVRGFGYVLRSER
jgi:two-component system OmpR family response regulator